MAALLTNEQRLQVYFLEPTFDACICKQFNRSYNLKILRFVQRSSQSFNNGDFGNVPSLCCIIQRFVISRSTV